jgi:hypothetical protein
MELDQLRYRSSCPRRNAGQWRRYVTATLLTLSRRETMMDAITSPHWLRIETSRHGCWQPVGEDQRTDLSIDQIELSLRIAADDACQPYRALLNGVRVVECHPSVTTAPRAVRGYPRTSK